MAADYSSCSNQQIFKLRSHEAVLGLMDSSVLVFQGILIVNYEIDEQR